ncbi:hypothetical protein [Jatrophihabitans sp.]|uniref:hypothetical protein n=1 Tax=Jatrophihabitans sp. TaxID=1932789 RepID=UPI0030C6F30F|nr:hypothetical protein [Jatrophihabitans sp.]
MDLAAEEWTLNRSGDRSDSGFAAWVEPHLAALSAVAVRQVGHDEAADVVLVSVWLTPAR